MIDWTELLRLAQEFLKSAKIPSSEWSLGGGTALMIYYNHRKSNDIDIFIKNAQLLTYLTPRLNDYVSHRVDDYNEMSNFLKLRIDQQEIDFIVAPFLTEDPVLTRELNGEIVFVETPQEIAVKKIFYRAEVLKVRDFCDLAFVFKHDKTSLLKNLKIFEGKLSALKERFEKIKPHFATELKALMIIDRSVNFLSLCAEFIRECEKLSGKKETRLFP